MKNQCSPETVIGAMFAKRETTGLGNKDIGTFEDIGPAGVSQYNDVRTRAYALDYDALSSVKDKSLVERVFVGDGVDIAKETLLELRLPSSVLGEDALKPVRGFLEDHYATHMDDLKAGRSDYFSGIKDALEEVDTTGWNPAQQDYFTRYALYYKNGGEMYGMNSGSGFEKMVGNAVGNTIKSSPTVLIGNIAEGVIKLPTFYPKEVLPALFEQASNGTLFKEIPELARKGVYGVNYAGEEKGIWKGLIGLTDVPLKNIAYSAGEMASPGSGALAVQKVAFKPRFGDLPLIYAKPVGRSTIQLMGYTLNSYRMYHGMWKSATGLNGADRVAEGWRQVATYHGMTAAIGGAGAAVPALLSGGDVGDVVSSAFGGAGSSAPVAIQPIVQMALSAINPDWESIVEENDNYLAKLIRMGNINRVGIGFDITTRNGQKAYTAFQDGITAFQDGDTVKGVMDLADMGLYLSSLTNAWVGDAQAQKAIRLARDAFMGEVEMDELLDEATDRFRVPNPMSLFEQPDDSAEITTDPIQETP